MMVGIGVSFGWRDLVSVPLSNSSLSAANVKRGSGFACYGVRRFIAAFLLWPKEKSGDESPHSKEEIASRPVSRVLCLPLRAGDGHFSSRPVARPIVQPTR